MPSPPSQKRYYDKNRESILLKMRTRETERRASRGAFLDTHPDEAELERVRMRDKYHIYTTNKCRAQLEEWIRDPDSSPESVAFFKLLVADERYRALKPKTLQHLADALGLASSKLG